MTIRLFLVLLFAVALLPTTNALSFDLAGVELEGASPYVVDVSNTNSNAVSAINFSFVYSTAMFPLNGATGSELIIQLGHLPTNTFVQIGTSMATDNCSGLSVACDFNLDFTDTNGEFSAAGSVSFDVFEMLPLSELITNGSGVWELFIFTSNDGGTGPEGTFLSGSLSVSQVPLPGAAVLLLSALAGVGAVRRSVSAR